MFKSWLCLYNQTLIFTSPLCHCVFMQIRWHFLCQQGRRHWTVYYTGSQKLYFHVIILWAQKLWVLFYKILFVGSKLAMPILLTNMFNQPKGYFCHHWGCISNYCPLSYSWRSLNLVHRQTSYCDKRPNATNVLNDKPPKRQTF